ncbi:two-component system regulatory protein YycI [Paenibacillus hodogayensis]|uniref:Two-component system regulatory protein YycI n=1 Tax=Paenibacillus hodogayensis TaxID=279208 RepID=A0ABV5W0C0_9BACL
MDWSRAKSIFILSFLALNLLLGYELWSGKWNAIGESKKTSADIAQELDRIMVSRGIKMSASVPKETPKMREITVKWVDGETYGRKISLPEPLRYNLFLSKGSLKDLASRAIPKIESYAYDRVTSKDGLFMMNQLFGEYPLFDVNLELYMTNGEVTGYRQAFVEVDTGSEGKEEKKVISAYTVLRTLAEKYLQNGSVVTDIRLGYHGQFFETEQWSTLPTFPTWRVALDNGDIYYVQGFRGDVETAERGAKKP